MAKATDIRAGGAFVELALHDTPYHRGLRLAQDGLVRFGQTAAKLGPQLGTQLGRTLASVSSGVRRVAAAAADPALWQRAFRRIANASAPVAADLRKMFATLGRNAAADLGRIGRLLARMPIAREVAGAFSNVGRDVGLRLRSGAQAAIGQAASGYLAMRTQAGQAAGWIGQQFASVSGAVRTNLTDPVARAFRESLVAPARAAASRLGAQILPPLTAVGKKVQAVTDKWIAVPSAKLGKHLAAQYLAPIQRFAARWAPPGFGMSYRLAGELSGAQRAMATAQRMGRAMGATMQSAAVTLRRLGAVAASAPGAVLRGARGIANFAGSIPIPRFGGGMGTVTAGMGRAAGSLSGAGGGMQSAGLGMMGGAAVAGAPLVAGVKAFSTLEDELAKLRAAANPTAEELDKIKASIRGISDKTGIDRASVAAGFTELVKAGTSVNAAIGGAAETVAKFSRVAGVDVSQSAIVVSDALNVFGKQGITAAAAANILSQAADSSSVDLHQMVMALSMSSAAAGLVEMPMRDLAAALGLVGTQNLKGSDAGTAIKTMLLRMAAPTDESAEAMKKYGLSVRDASGNLKPMRGIIAELQTKLGGLNAAERDAALYDIFGTDAIRPAAIMLKQGVAGWDAFTKKMGDSLSVDAKFAILMNTISGSLQRFWTVVKNAGIAIGTALEPSIRWLGESLSTVGKLLGYWLEQHQDAIRTAALWIAGIAATGAALWSLGAAMKFLAFGFSGIAMFGKIAMGGLLLIKGAAGMLLGVVGALLSPIGLIGAAIGGLAGYAVYASGAFQNLAANAGSTWANIRQTATDTLAGIRDAIAAGDMQLAAEIAWAGVKVAWQTGLNWLYAGWLDFKGFFQRVWTEAVYKVASIGTTAWAGMKAAWVIVGSFFRDVWNSTINSVKTMWASAQGWLAKAWIKGMKTIGVYDEKKAADALKILEEDEKREEAKQKATAAKKKQDSEAQKQKDLAAIGTEEEGTLAALEKARQTEQNNITSANDKALQNSKDDLAAKKKALADLTAKSKTAAEEKRKKDEEEQRKSTETQGKDAEDESKRLANAAKGAIAGTFNAGLAAMLIGIGTVAPTAKQQPLTPLQQLEKLQQQAEADQNSTLTPEAQEAAKDNAGLEGLVLTGGAGGIGVPKRPQSANDAERRQAAIEAAMAEDPGLTFTGGAGGIGVPKRPTAPSAADINRAAAAAPAAVAQAATAAAPVASSGVWDAIAANTASTVTKLEAIRLLLERGGGSSQPRYRR